MKTEMDAIFNIKGLKKLVSLLEMYISTKLGDLKNEIDTKLNKSEKYVHPSTHPASIIVEDSAHRFVSDNEKTVWNGKLDKSGGTMSGSIRFEPDKGIVGIQSTSSAGIYPDRNNSINFSSGKEDIYFGWRQVGDNRVKKYNFGDSTPDNDLEGVNKGTLYADDYYYDNGTKSLKASLDSKLNKTDKYVHPSTHSATIITQDSTHRFVSDSEKTAWNDKYTKNEINSKFDTLSSGIYWKESVDTFSKISSTYPSPEDGWTVNVKDTDYTYRYNGSSWIAISANSIPIVTSSVDGKMSKSDKSKLDGIASGANKYVLPIASKTVLGGVKIGSNITISNGTISTHAPYIHPNTHPASMITQDSTHRLVTDSEKTSWNGKLDKSGGTIDGNLEITGATTVPYIVIGGYKVEVI